MKHLLIGLVVVSGCRSAAADPSPTSDLRKTPAFHAIELTGSIVVEARIDRATRVEVRGDADRIADVSTTVRDGVLAIGTKRYLGKVTGTPLRVIVTAPDLSALTISGSGQILASGLANARLDVAIPGAGQITVFGKTTAVRLDIAGTGSIDAGGLVAETAAIEASGTAQATLHATKTLDTKISGTAAITVHGKPRVTKSNSGIVAISTL